MLFQLQPDLLHPDLPDPPDGDGALLPADGEEALGGEDHWGGHSFLGKEQEDKTEGNYKLDDFYCGQHPEECPKQLEIGKIVFLLDA